MYLELTELKKKYNSVLATEKKAEDFFNSPEQSMVKKQKWLPKFNKIVEELSTMILQYHEITGTEMTEDEVLNGFCSLDMIE